MALHLQREQHSCMKESTMWLRVILSGKVNQFSVYNIFMHSSVRGTTNAGCVLERGTEMHVHRQTGCLLRCS